MTITMPTFPPGAIRTRAEIFKELGGGGQGGICPSIEMKTIILFSDLKSGEKYGYRDGWLREEDQLGPVFEYTGMGAQDDQKFKGNNKSVLQHAEDGRTLHLFIGHGKVPGTQTRTHRYIGAFEVAQDPPYTWRRARDERGHDRYVIVFRLRPISQFQRLEEDAYPLPTTTRVRRLFGRRRRPEGPQLPRESQDRLSSAARAAARMSNSLITDLEHELAEQQHQFGTLEIEARGREGLLEAALYDDTAHTVFEPASRTTHREITDALMKLADISRYLSAEHNGMPLRCMVLAPDAPSDDIRDLLAHQGVGLLYRNESGALTELPLDGHISPPSPRPTGFPCADCPSLRN
ncbi:hypothetical protein [Streptomyces sp. VRA16 Mangrove soil]|uniref:hypothetical protein n=1 Tax=Streptomyces sp. VRA16 Mangrove soil TaxID=2817434 RepID=UPI001A9D09D1|nr:hypothetical protein [Streptomyces sp. VRA16 Mangrove soil]MBO1337697.1 hypothetical protein [Streptomyces sp. VRA16 Mangrove soil]